MSDKETTNKNRLVWLLLLAGILILLFWAGLKTWRIYQSSSSLLARQEQAKSLLENGPRNMSPQDAADIVYGIRGDVVTLNNEVSFLMPVMPYLGWLPKVGHLAASAPQLMEMADAGTEAAAYGFRGLHPALFLLQEDNQQGSMLPEMVIILENARPDLAQASLSMDRVVAARDEIENTEEFPWRVRSLLETADAWLPLAQGGLKMIQVLPNMLGSDGPRRYLIIAQNEDELRATGGFISGAGLVELENGRITKLDFQDANSVDAWGGNQVLTKPYGDSPQALSELMLLDLFLFRDANFWPQFPISADKAMDLYSYGKDVPPVDGAIAIDQQFIKLLVSGTGPVMIPDTGDVINENNAIRSLQDAWTLEDGVGQRKAFLGVFAQAIRNRLENELSGIDPVHLAREIGTALENKDLQISARDPLAAAILTEVGWDGRLLEPTDHDALMAVDTNMGYNKANIFIERAMSYHVQLANDGGAQADLTITHKHIGEDDGEPCSQGTLDEYRAGGSYRDLTNKCYWNYLRVYIPENSRLISGPQHIVPGETWYGGYDWDRPAEVLNELPGFTTFASFMLLPKASEISSQFVYEIPDSITQVDGKQQKYQLRLYKQAGSPVEPVEIAVTVPPGSRIISAQPKPTKQENDMAIFNINLNSDETISVTFD